MIAEIMKIYETIFSPIFVSGSILLYISFKNNGFNRFKEEFKILLISFLPVLMSLILYLYLVPKNPEFLKDVVVASSFLFSFGIVKTGYYEERLSKEVFDYLLIIFIASVPFVLISPFWNISGHVLFSTVPIFYLVLRKRGSFLLIIIPFIMVYNRPFLNEHTWFQSIFTLLFSLLIVGLKSKSIPHRGK
ncbi:hypothetical protein C9439_05910 [archaeon SCG-AAA382B04]|nr:hypothetical protein C9439_05910 [archaeon SCG-AAA382B04]